MCIFELDHATLTYGTAKPTPIFRDLNLRVERGSFLAVMGPSGSGKTSLINVMAGFLPLTEGRVKFDGTSLSEMGTADISAFRTRCIGMVHQFFNLIPELSAEQNVMAALLLNGLTYNESHDRAAELLEQVGLRHRLHYRPAQLSGGEQQRVAIARAVANSPDALLCDEPTGNLDEKNSKAILSLLQDIREASNTTVVMVTHDRNVENVATDLIEMRSLT